MRLYHRIMLREALNNRGTLNIKYDTQLYSIIHHIQLIITLCPLLSFPPISCPPLIFPFSSSSITFLLLLHSLFRVFSYIFFFFFQNHFNCLQVSLSLSLHKVPIFLSEINLKFSGSSDGLLDSDRDRRSLYNTTPYVIISCDIIDTVSQRCFLQSKILWFLHPFLYKFFNPRHWSVLLCFAFLNPSWPFHLYFTANHIGPMYLQHITLG